MLQQPLAIVADPRVVGCVRLPHCRPLFARRRQDRIDTGARRLAEAVEGPSCNHVDAAAVAGLAAALARAAAAGSAPALPAPSAATAIVILGGSAARAQHQSGGHSADS